MAAPRTAAQIRDVNARYHDVAAETYDVKWGIDFGAKGRAQVLAKMRKALGRLPARPYPRALEIGAGTGYFSLNLVRAGVVNSAVCTDISAGMLDALRANAAALGIEVQAVDATADALPFGDESFQLVFGHAVLHHLPDLRAAMEEFVRVLAPGGELVFAGEPSRHGDRIAAVPKRGAQAVAPLWRRLMGAGPAPWVGNGEVAGDHELERWVDVHAFTPGELSSLARDAGLEAVRVRGEELVANWFGWANRALEATADPDDLPWLWFQYAYRGYLALQRVDAHLLEPRLPPAVFYNLLLSARKPIG